MVTEESRAIFSRLAAALNAGNFEALDEIFAPDYVRHDPSSLLREAGIQEYKQAFATIRRAFPNARWTNEDLLQDGDKVIGRWTFRGTNDGPFFGLPPTGREVTYPIISIYRIENGRIAEDWHIFHALGLWEQLIPQIREIIAEAMGE